MTHPCKIYAAWTSVVWLLASAPLAGAASGTEAVDALFPAPAPSSPAVKQQEYPSAGEMLPSEKDAEQMQKRLDTIEARLGMSSRPPSVANNMERRLADLEKRVQQIEQQLARMSQFDQRIRRLEMK